MINWAHAHLLLNHIPVIGMLLLLPLLAWGLRRRSQDIIRASVALLLILSVTSVAVFLTGEPAEGAVEEIAGVSEQAVELHEEAALFATVAMGLVGAFALALLARFRRRPIPLRSAAGLLLLTLIPAGAVAWTANLGGQIRHSEIRSQLEVTSQTEVDIAGRAP